MKSCILTIIKNEQQYLDEWINYHLSLGIDHIFIFEDIDSDSHKEICDKYGDNVSLDGIFSILDDATIEKAKEVKSKKKFNVLHIYYKSAILYLQREHKEYDWCFVIDNDEFITLDGASIDDVLQDYDGYDAFVMSWKCYGANGLVNKPDYTNKGVLETYTKEAECKIPNEVKTCFNLHRYNGCFFSSHHYPSSIANWCNTNFIKNKTIPCYNKVYIRHYITKSWEEYVWKRKTRGFTWGKTRSFDFFFAVNTDMMDKKEELINQIKDDVLVVMPYKQSGSQGNEIRLALSGWRRFCQFKYRFVVIGEFDESLVTEFPWVRFINCPSVPKNKEQYNPHLDIINKYRIISRLYGQEYNGFIKIMDDQYPIKPFELKDVTSIYYHASTFIGCEKCPTSFWRHDKWKTRQLLDKENLPHINYTTHHPCYFEFEKLKEIWDKFNMRNESYVLEDVYFNYFKHEEPKLDSHIRLGIWNKSTSIQGAINNPNIKFVCNSVDGWSKELEDELRKIIYV